MFGTLSHVLFLHRMFVSSSDVHRDSGYTTEWRTGVDHNAARTARPKKIGTYIPQCRAASTHRRRALQSVGQN